ncbi:DUF4178 domain-containing protein [Mucilaginibacter terrae]|uniref:DUF4178 domain-containing protein n=1 Tax=Mucilaginibacter terrae TaxID=1955052 RepID=UPI003639A4CE
MATHKLTSFPNTEVATCPQCNQSITLYDPAGSEFCVCPNCHSFIRFIADDYARTQKQAPLIKSDPIIPIGTEGVLKGIPYKVIAYIEKKESATVYAWREYLLYNYEKGYANLAEFDGHWNLVAGKAFYPELEGLGNNSWGFVQYQNIEYKMFNKYTAVITGLIGEFDWDLLSEKIKVTEFIAPPFIIYKELGEPAANKPELYLGEYTEASTIADAFKVDLNRFPDKIGIGANQFSMYYSRWYTVSRVTVFLILAMLAIQLAILLLKPEKVVMDQDFVIGYDSTKAGDDFKSFATPAFMVNDASSAMEINLGSAIDNNWLEATVTLVNEKTNQSWEVTEGVEYYHGYEGGENWSEGSQQTTVLLSSIPAGKYHLNVYPASGNKSLTNLRMAVTTNVTLWMNLFITCLLLCLYPIYCWVRMQNFEKQRWVNSDFSPYETDE